MVKQTLPVTAVEISDNTKVGKISITGASQHSCPATCPFRGSGCYAEVGRANLLTSRLNDSDITDPLEIAKCEAEAIGKLSGRRMLRLHVVGDVCIEEGVSLLALAAAKHTAKHGKPVFTYTHGHETSRESWGSISVLRSCETFAQVQKAHADGFASAMVVDSHESDTAYDKEGFTIIPCPQQTGRAKDCAQCKLCSQDKKLHAKKAVIAFAVHGAREKKAKEMLSDLNKVA